MFYDFSNKRKMECERYQDCSWFQQDLMKESIKGKLSLAETAEPIIDIDEFHLAMQYATDHTIPRGENDIIGFDDVFLEGNKFEEPLKNTSAMVDDDCVFDSKKVEGNTCDEFNQFYGLRKTDSFDNMEYISSTNPAEIIPISLMERMNYSNCGLTTLNIKNEAVKEEELYSPDSTSQFMQTDESDLVVGREEIVEENEAAAEQACKAAVIDPKLQQLQVPGSVSSNVEGVQATDLKPVENVEECAPTSTIKTESISNDRLDFNLDLPKVTFEQSFGISTPDLDFMDLVDFINEDIQKINSSNVPTSTTNKTSVEKKIVNLNSVSSKTVEEKVSTTSKSDSSAKTPPKEETSQIEESNDLPDDTTSIAERIKTKAKRRVTKKYVAVNGSSSEEDDDENFEPNDEEDANDDDDDDDYEARVGKKRRCIVNNRKFRSTSTAEVATSQMRGGPEKTSESAEKIDSYRERRDKNNEASRRSRQNRKDRERHMFKTLEEEERRNVKLRAEADILEKQVTSLRKLLLQVVLRKADGT